MTDPKNAGLLDRSLTDGMIIAFLDGKHDFKIQNYGADTSDIRGMQNVLAFLVNKGIIPPYNPPAEATSSLVSEEAIERIQESALGNLAQFYGQMPTGDYEKMRGDIILLSVAAQKNRAISLKTPTPPASSPVVPDGSKGTEDVAGQCRAEFEEAYGAAWEKSDFATFDRGMYHLSPSKDTMDPYEYHKELNQDWIAFRKGWESALQSAPGKGVDAEVIKKVVKALDSAFFFSGNVMKDKHIQEALALLTAEDGREG